MQLRITNALTVFFLSMTMLGLLACGPSSPEDQVLESRSKYTVTLNAFVVQEPEIEAPVMESGDMAGGDLQLAGGEVTAVAVATETATEGEEGAEGETDEMVQEEVGPSTSSVLFDLVVRFDGTEPLSGLTLDISQADPFEPEKASLRHYMELDPMVKSETKQVSFVLDDIEYEEGDLFSVTLREFVPPEERGDYREFAAAP